MSTLTPLEILHQHFCCDSNREPRSYMHTPHIVCGRICATNGHWIGALDQLPAADHGLPLLDVQRGYDPSNILQAVYAYTGDFVPATTIGIRTEKCTRCRGTGRAIYVGCFECDGNGYFVHGSHDYKCKECHAEGEIVQAGTGPTCRLCHGVGRAPVRIKSSTHGDPSTERSASSIYVAALRAIGGEISVTTVRSPASEFYVLRFPGGHGALMPMCGRPLRLHQSDLAPAAIEPEAVAAGGAA
jgi:hypothetical protein